MVWMREWRTSVFRLSYPNFTLLPEGTTRRRSVAFLALFFSICSANWTGSSANLSPWVVWTTVAVFLLARSVAQQKSIRKARRCFGAEDLKSTLHRFGGILLWVSSSLTHDPNAPLFSRWCNGCPPWVHLPILFHSKRNCYSACSKMMLQCKSAPRTVGCTGDSLQLIWTKTLTHMPSYSRAKQFAEVEWPKKSIF